MKTVEEQIKEMSGKLLLFIKKYEALIKENKKLSEELAESSKNEKTALEKMSLLKTENSILKASADKMGEKERIGFEKQINQYIKDIEKCVSLLNK